jgi:hypothetical protein
LPDFAWDTSSVVGFVASSSSSLPPLAQPPPTDERAEGERLALDRLRRRELLGGLIHEYQLAA